MSRPIRVCVLGTSNGLYRDGYVSTLLANGTIGTVDNFSIGASQNIFCAFRFNQIDFAQYQFCICDFCVNDAPLLDADARKWSVIADFFVALVERATAAGCLPVVLLMPTRNLDEAPGGRLHYRRMAGMLHLPVLDGYDLVRRIADRLPVDHAKLFLDAAHLHQALAREIGHVLSDAMARIDQQAPRPLGIDVAHSYAFHFLGQDPALAPRVVHRATSLIAVDLVELTEGESCRFRLPTGQRIVGIGINASLSIGAARFVRHTAFQRTVTSRHFWPERGSLVFSVMPILGDDGRGDVVEIGAEAEPDAFAGAVWKEHRAGGGQARLSIAGLVVETPRLPVAVPALLDAAIDVVGGLTETQLDRLCKVARNLVAG